MWEVVLVTTPGRRGGVWRSFTELFGDSAASLQYETFCR